MLTKSYIHVENLRNAYNLLSISSKETTFEVSSSWYSWSRNVDCSIKYMCLQMKETDGKRFFEKNNIFPESDFYLSTKKSIFNFVIKAQVEDSNIITLNKFFI